MEYAVFQMGNKQYKASVGDLIMVDRLSESGDKVTFDKVLLVVSDGDVKIGKPTLPNIRVIGKSEGDVRGEKLRVSHYKSKVRYRRTIGFRADYTKIKIEKIETQGSKVGSVQTKSIKKSPKISRKA